MAEYLYLTTRGRRTGQPHTIEIWYAQHEGRLYLMAGGREQSDWVRNLRANPAVEVRIGARSAESRGASARLVAEPEEDALVRRLLAAKYQHWREGEPLSGWAQTALPVAIEFPPGRAPAE